MAYAMEKGYSSLQDFNAPTNINESPPLGPPNFTIRSDANSPITIPVKRCGKALLVEPAYPTKFPPVQLLKFSTFLKRQGYDTMCVKGCVSVGEEIDEILITTLFTRDWLECVRTIMFYRAEYPNARVHVGGVYASLFPQQVLKRTGVTACVGAFKDIDELAPDYELINCEVFESTSHIITSRGCPRNCGFCGTKTLEPRMRIIRNWRGHILPGSLFVMIHDNNILAHGDRHFFSVVNYLTEKGYCFSFDNGFDCRLFTNAHAKALSLSSISEVRFAFDTMEEDGHIQRAIQYCLSWGIAPRRIKVFVLYNYEDDLEDALYRANEVKKAGATPWAMRYSPMNWLNPVAIHIGKHWDKQKLVSFHKYVNGFGIMDHMTYDEFLSRRNKLQKKKEFKVNNFD